MEFVTYEVDGLISIITINRPNALNALNSRVLEELDQILDYVDTASVRALILTGAGNKSFVAGADIAEMSTFTKKEGKAFGKRGNDIFRRLETFPLPVIAAVNGFALGGGCELCLSCDIRICSEIIGPGMAKQMMFTARSIKAEEAYRIGLVNAVYPQRELLLEAIRMAKGIADNAPIAVRNCKKAINDGLQVDMDQAVAMEEQLFGDCFETLDQKEGMGAFLEKRKERTFLMK